MSETVTDWRGEMKIEEVSYGFYIKGSDGAPLEYTRYGAVKHYKTRANAEKAMRRIAKTSAYSVKKP